MKTIALKGHYEDNEWVWDTEFDPEVKNYVLRLNGGNLTPLFILLLTCQLPHECNLFLPWFPNIMNGFEYIGLQKLVACEHRKIIFFDNCSEDLGNYQNIIPNWSKYIPEDSAVLFLSEEDYDKYNSILNNYSCYKYPIVDKLKIQFLLKTPDSQRDYCRFSENKFEEKSPEYHYVISENAKKISIIVPYINSKNIEQLNNIAQELKEKYGVEWVQLVVSHSSINPLKNKYIHKLEDENLLSNTIICDILESLNNNTLSLSNLKHYYNSENSYITIEYTWKKNIYSTPEQCKGTFGEIFGGRVDIIYDTIKFKLLKIRNSIMIDNLSSVDKITTTNSTRILEVQDTEKLTVVDCVEFFEGYLGN